MSRDVQDRLSAAFAARTELVTEQSLRPADNLQPGRAGGSPGRGRWAMPVLAAAVAALVVGGTVFVAKQVTDRANQPATVQTPVATSPSVRPNPTVSATSPLTPSPDTSSVPTNSPTVRSTPTTTAHRLVPADSQYPAGGGSCDPAAGTVVVLDLNPDVPTPRCLGISAGQQLKVVNTSNQFGDAGKTVTVHWADFPDRTLTPGASTVYTEPAGTYLATGVHWLTAPPLYAGSNAAIWLK